MAKKPIEEILKDEFSSMPAEFYKVLTFGELSVGDKYIVLPSPGDNQGRGGFKGPYYLFQKISHSSSDNSFDNAIRLKDGIRAEATRTIPVIKIE